jgi:hypothetical protein
MWIYRSVLAVVGGSCLVVLSATLTRTAASVALPTPGPVVAEPAAVSPAPAPSPDAAAEHHLDVALDALRPERIGWLETTIWQKVHLPGYVYEADGVYRLAPGDRFRMEMHTHPGGSDGTLLMLSDGQALWQAERAGEGPWENVKRLNLVEVLSSLNGPAAAQLRDEFFQRPHFQGMTPLLRNLRSRLIWARSETLRHGEGEQIHLTGVWSKEDAAKLAPPDHPWPTGLPRQCHLYLDAKTYWPIRVEWWGPITADATDRLLVQMEFRNPVFNRRLPEEECRRLFAFHPGAATVEDETATVTAELSKRAGELAASR